MVKTESADFLNFAEWKGSVIELQFFTHSRVEATICYKLVLVISWSLSRELPRVKLEKN